MRKRVSLTMAALALAGLACAWPGLAASAASTARSQAPLWADRFVQGGFPAGAAASATEVFVTGDGARHHVDAFATEAYSAATGARLWSARFNPSTSGRGTAVAVNPAGTAVFVTGSGGFAGGSATVGYNAATGAQLWAARHSGPSDGFSNPLAIAVSPDGSTVFVTGYTAGAGTPPSAAMTIAYNAASGAQLWARSYRVAAEGDSISVNPDGSAVYVTGYGPVTSGGPDYITIAYAATTGTRQWVARYNGPANGSDQPSAVAVSMDGREVAVTGSSQGAADGLDYATVAYNAASGARLWARRYNGGANSVDVAAGLAFSQGGKLFVTGASGSGSDSAYATIAYTAARGHRLWVSRFNPPGQQSTGAVGVAVPDPATGQVFVTGTADGARRGINTIAYNAASGTAIWASRYPPPGHSTARAIAIAVNQDFVFAVGHTGTGGGYITLAYPTGG